MSRLELVDVETRELWDARERGFLGLAAIIARYQATGWATEHDTLDVIAMTWGMVHGVVDLWVGGPLAAPYDGHEMIDTVTRLLDAQLTALDT